MALKYYHAEPLANSLKSMVPLKEKGLAYESHYVDLHKFEQHSEWFVKINPEGQVPVLDHNGVLITHTTVINEYLEDVFPEIPPSVDLTIAAHTHGGQVYLPGFGRPIVPSAYGERYAIGHVVEAGRHLFVSAGLGTSILPVRFLVPPEISVLTLRRAAR